jgi:hypothetical protein
MKVFTTIDHSGEARGRGLELRVGIDALTDAVVGR